MYLPNTGSTFLHDLGTGLEVDAACDADADPSRDDVSQCWPTSLVATRTVSPWKATCIDSRAGQTLESSTTLSSACGDRPYVSSVDSLHEVPEEGGGGHEDRDTLFDHPLRKPGDAILYRRERHQRCAMHEREPGGAQRLASPKRGDEQDAVV